MAMNVCVYVHGPLLHHELGLCDSRGVSECEGGSGCRLPAGCV